MASRQKPGESSGTGGTGGTSNEDLLQLAIRAAKTGQKDGAKVMFRQVYNRDKRNERAMMWLAKLSKTPRERQQWLRRVLQINPSNEAAAEALRKMQYRSAASDNRLLLIALPVLITLMVIVFAVIAIALSS